MNTKHSDLLKKFSYTFSSNLLSFLVSTLVVLVLPKIIGIQEYGYWQLYSFYVSYIVFLHFGWSDGIYLRIGGEEYNNLDKKTLFSQFYMLLVFQVIISILIYVIGVNIVNDINRLYIIKIISLMLVISNVLSIPKFILQATGRIREYAQITIIDRVLYVILIAFALTIGIREFKLLILADVIGKMASLFLAIYYCKDIILRPIADFSISFKEAWENIRIGIKLLLAYVASMLIIGNIRFGIERTWDVATFGKVSLTLSATNLMMLFINAIGIIMFPILRKTDKNKLSTIYTIIKDFLMIILLGLLNLYYPIKTLLSAWLPRYSDSLMYMALVFPMFIYEGKMALLINTYFKTLRKEKLMLQINIVSLGLSLVVTGITTLLLKNLNLAIVSIVIVLAFRSILAEVKLSKILSISVSKDILLELSLTLIFILSGWFINSWHTVLVYIIAYCIYIFIKRKDIVNTIQSIKILMKY